ncbi:hypothetical protein D3C81_725430 [compost metagenome]
MTDAQCLKLAEQYLQRRNIGYLPFGLIGRREQDQWEVIFPVPESIDPTVAVIDPPDVRVWVNISQELVEFIHQM